MPDAPKPLTLDRAFSALVLGYLSQANEDQKPAQALPSRTDLPRVHVLDNKAKTWPLLVVAGEVKPEGPKIRIVTVVAALHRKIPKQGEADTKYDDDAAIMQAVCERLRDLAALDAYMASLADDAIAFPADARLTRKWAGEVGQLARDTENGTDTIPCSITFRVRMIGTGN